MYHSPRTPIPVLLLTLATAVTAAPLTETRTTVRFPLTLGNAPILVRKQVDLATGECRILSNSPLVGSYSDLRRLQATEQAARRARYGALDRALHHRSDTLGAQTVRVLVTLQTAHMTYPSRFTHSTRELQAAAAAAQHLAPVVDIQTFCAAHGILPEPRADRDGFACTLDRTALLRVARDPRVACVSPLEPGEPCGSLIPFTSLADAALNPAQHPLDMRGAGVVVATVEALSDTHPLLTGMCLANAAPAATRLHLEDNFYSPSWVVSWLISSGVEVSSLSLSRPPPERTPHSRESVVMDDMAYLWPCPLFCTPAGNAGDTAEVQWQSYAALCAGSVKHWQEREYVFDRFSCARNPQPEYGACIAGTGDSCGSDRELPEILAPGSHPYEPPDIWDPSHLWYTTMDTLYCRVPGNLDSQYVCGYYPGWSFPGRGTSFSAPIANGMAARLISANRPLLAHKPDAIKMALMLTAHDVDSAEWDPAVDGHDGAGVLSAYDAVAYATSCTDLTFDSVPRAVEHGFVTGEADTAFAERTFRVLVPQEPREGTHLRVTLVWTSNPDLVNSNNYLSDLDIGGFAADSGVYGSYSLDASVEIFDVPRAVLSPGGTYSFTLYPRDIRIPEKARTRFFYYTLGWTWVPDHAGIRPNTVQPRCLPGQRPVLAVRPLGGGRFLCTVLPNADATLHYRFMSLGGRVAAEGIVHTSGSARSVVIAPHVRLQSGMYVVHMEQGSVSARVPLVLTAPQWGNR